MSEVLLEKPADGIAVVRLNRPEVRNALNLVVREHLAKYFFDLGNDEATRCIIVTGGRRDGGSAEQNAARDTRGGSAAQKTAHTVRFAQIVSHLSRSLSRVLPLLL